MTGWDEARTERGDIRPHWRPLLRVLDGSGLAPSRSGGGCGCDPVPFLLPDPEFRDLQDGLEQRARLLQALLDDLRGEQAAVSSGALPAPFAAADRCPMLRQGTVIEAYAAELVRCPDGEWRVLAERVDGKGTALAGFLPGVCRVLLRESLRVASIPALWLADPGAMRIVAGGYRRWSVRDAFDPAAAPVALAGLSREQRLDLQARLDAQPWRFIGCMYLPPSVAPSLGHDGLEWRPLVLRLVLQRRGAAWRLGPGSIAQVEAPDDGHRFKHLWIVREPGPGQRAAVPAPWMPIAAE